MGIVFGVIFLYEELIYPEDHNSISPRDLDKIIEDFSGKDYGDSYMYLSVDKPINAYLKEGYKILHIDGETYHLIRYNFFRSDELIECKLAMRFDSKSYNDLFNYYPICRKL